MINNDDDPDKTPLPPTRRPSLAAYEPSLPAIDGQKTKIAVEIKAAVIISSALLTAGFGAGTALFRLTNRIDNMDRAVALTASRADLNEAKREIRSEVRRAINAGGKQYLVKCPRTVLRGTGDIVCPAVLLPTAAAADDE